MLLKELSMCGESSTKTCTACTSSSGCLPYVMDIEDRETRLDGCMQRYLYCLARGAIGIHGPLLGMQEQISM